MDLVEQVEDWLKRVPRPARSDTTAGAVACPTFRFGDRLVRTVTTITTFRDALDVTLQELRIEQIFPAGPESESFFREPVERSEPG